MPTYVYTCDACHMQFEKVQRFSDDPIQECPYCEEESVRRVFQPVGVVFKGTGWYITDSRANNASQNGAHEHTKSKQKDGDGDGNTSGNDSSEKKSTPETSSSAEGTSTSTPASTPTPTPPST